MVKADLVQRTLGKPRRNDFSIPSFVQRIFYHRHHAVYSLRRTSLHPDRRRDGFIVSDGAVAKQDYVFQWQTLNLRNPFG